LQVGAELYGHRGFESDFEVIALMIEALRAVGVPDLHLDLAHVGIFRGLTHQAGLSREDETRLFDALQRKAKPEIRDLLAQVKVAPAARDMLLALADLNGGVEVLSEAARVLAKADASVQGALGELRALAQAVAGLGLSGVHLDLAELRGYAYHTGAVFAAFVPGRGQAIAQGGRYDDIGRIFGRSRPATGFSMDLNGLLPLAPADSGAVRGIFAPADDDAQLARRIRELRSAGERVIRALPGQTGGAAAMGCDRTLVRHGSDWQVISASD
jgi:ATP phosphoribosyltransferase regulatory subunit